MMKRLSSIRVLFSVILLTVFFCGAGSAVTVGPGETYTTIQGGIDAAVVGDTINVKAGTYTENVAISKDNLTLKSIDGDGLAIINGNGVSPVITVNPNVGVTLDGFSIGGNTQHGIVFVAGTPTSLVTITNNTITDCNSGMYLSFSNYAGTITITGNTISDCTANGIYVYGVDGGTVLISENNLTDCDMGIYTDSLSNTTESDITISDNTITATLGFSGYAGINAVYPERTTKITGNTVTGDYSYGIYVDGPGGNGLAPSVLYIDDNTITVTGAGLHIYEIGYSDPAIVYIRRNTLTACDTGLYFEEICYNDYGRVYMEDNTISENTSYGIYIDNLAIYYYVDFNMTGNTVADNDIGMHVAAFTHQDISLLNITNNNFSGNITYAFENASVEDIELDGNWWGAADGPSGDGPGSGDAISVGGNLVPSVFLTSSYTPPPLIIVKKSDSGGCAFGGSGSSGMAGMIAMLCLGFFFLKRKIR